MATEVVKIVDTGGGGDYSSLAAWEADFGSCTQSNYPSMSGDGDLVGADLIAVADCRCSTGAADTTAVTIDGWTTDNTRYIKIWTDPNENYRHDGKWNTSAYRIVVTSGDALAIREEYTKIFGLQIDCTSKPSGSSGIHIYSNYTYIGYSIIRNAERGIKPFLSSRIVYMWNSIIINCWRAIDNDDDTSSSQYAYNITAVGSDNHGILRCLAKNCLCKGYSSACFYGLASGSDYNASDDDTGDDWGSYGRANQTFTFVDEVNDNYHLDSSDTGAKDYGTDLSSDPYLSFTDDIDGETRSGTWDIGADEYVAAGGTITGSANIQSASSTSSATLAVLRALSASIQAQTNTATPQLNLLLTAIADIQAVTNTSAITLALLKTALANITGQTNTSTALLNVLRSVSADIQAQSYTADDVDLTVVGLITAIANILAATNTSTIDLAVLRALSAAINAQSFASDSVELSIAGLIQAIANIATQTSTSDVALAVLRPVTADIQAQSVTSAVTLGLIYSLTASIQAATTTPDDIDLVLIKIGQAQITVSTQTAQAALNILRSLSAAISVGTTTSDALLAVLREATAQVDATTLTSAINLITAGLGLIVDTTIESLTVGRTLTSLTPERTFTSLTPERTIEEV